MPDILVRGMEMPSGAELLCVNIHPNGDVTINLDLKCTPIAHAVELPPHGELIDRDAACERYKHDPKKPEICDGAQDLDWLVQCLNEAPAVVPAERSEP